jgi:hypothetical protein
VKIHFPDGAHALSPRAPATQMSAAAAAAGGGGHIAPPLLPILRLRAEVHAVQRAARGRGRRLGGCVVGRGRLGAIRATRYSNNSGIDNVFECRLCICSRRRLRLALSAEYIWLHLAQRRGFSLEGGRGRGEGWAAGDRNVCTT